MPVQSGFTVSASPGNPSELFDLAGIVVLSGIVIGLAVMAVDAVVVRRLSGRW
ncbi:MAG: hypothetical protein M3077_03800 [Candidatus Dormibacteraeota bacterium]|nr:hypothetical protein [Candidatus Dormibacteraeota bacterium]